jgi:hypothetical protein
VPSLGCWAVAEIADRLEMVVVHDVVDAVHARGRDVGRLEYGEPFIPAAGGKDFVQS